MLNDGRMGRRSLTDLVAGEPTKLELKGISLSSVWGEGS